MDARNEPSTQEWCCLSDASAFLGVTDHTVRRYFYDDLIVGRDRSDGRGIEINVSSLLAFDEAHPPQGKAGRRVTRNPAVEQGIYPSRGKNGRMRYEVKINGQRGKTFDTIGQARIYKRKLLNSNDRAMAATGGQTTGHSRSMWSRLTAWLNASDTTTA